MRSKAIIALSFLLAFVATAAAAGAVTPEDGSLLDLARPVLEAILHGQWWLGASLALVFVCTAARKYGASRFPFLGSGAGGALLVLLSSFGGAMATALTAAGTNAVTWALMLMAGKVALVAAGGYSLIKTLAVDPLLASKWYAEKAPAWLKAVMAMALWAFTKPSGESLAKKAGDAAVAANPPTGHEDPTDV